MKKIQFSVLTLVMLMFPMWVLAQSGTPGSSTNPFLISSFADLQAFRDGINSGSAFSYWANTSYTVNKGGQGQYFKIADSAPSGMGNDGGLVASTTEWVPIGTVANPFCGVFDGNNKVVGYRITSKSSVSNVGLFGQISTDAVVKNLTVIPYIASPSGVSNCGGVVARAASTSLIENCTVTTALKAGLTGSKVISTKIEVACNNVGGIVGFATNGATVKNCVNYLSVPGNSYVGGIVGQLYGQGTNNCKVLNCTNYGDVTGSGSVGGIVGYMPFALMSECVNYGAVTGSTNVGGVVGWMNRNSMVRNGANSGTVTGSSSVGGLVGKSTDGEDGYADSNQSYMQSSIMYSINTGCVYSTSTSASTNAGVGGIVGTSPATSNPASSSMSRRGTWVEGCTNYGIVDGCCICVGGIAGCMTSGTIYGVIASCGLPTSGTNMGGIVGRSGTSVTYVGCVYDPSYIELKGVGSSSTTPSGVIAPIGGNIAANTLAGDLSRFTYSYATNLCPVPTPAVDGDIKLAAEVYIPYAKKYSMEYASTFEIYVPASLTISSVEGKVTWEPKALSGCTQYASRSVSAGSDTILVKNANGVVLRKIPLYINAPRPGIDVPIQISTAAQLKVLRDGVNSGQSFSWTSPAVTIPAGAVGYKFELAADINIQGELTTHSGGLTGWTPIGKDGAPFMGQFDGKGHMIKNMYQLGDANTTSAVKNIGLFGVLYGATVCNLNVHAIYAVMDYAMGYVSCAGAIAGKALNGTSIRNCSAYGTVMGATKIGGIVGYAYEQVRLTGCRNAAIITGMDQVGGIAGEVEATETRKASVARCLNIGTITLKGDAKASQSVRPSGGGIVGVADYTELTDVMNAGLIEAGSYNDYNASACGGILGFGLNATTVDYALSVNSVVPDISDPKPVLNMIVGTFLAAGGCKFTHCYADESVVYAAENYSYASRYPTKELVNGSLQSNLENWQFNSGVYPTPCDTRNIIDSIASLPIYLAAGDYTGSVHNNIKLTPMTGLTWKSDNTSVMTVSGDSALLKASSESVQLKVSTTVPGVTLSSSIEKSYRFKVVRPFVVRFVDYDGTVLKTDTLNRGESATAPTVPTRTGYTFNGWDKEFTNVLSDLTVTATYKVKQYTVTFTGFEGVLLKTETVDYGKSATAPEVPTIEGYTFVGWTGDFSVVLSDLTIAARYDVSKYTVTFVDYDDRVIETQTITHGYDATAPAQPTRTGYTFNGWDKDFDNVKSDLTVKAQYTINTYTVTFVDYDDSSIKTQTVEYGKGATAPADPVREGYTFNGWNKDYSYVTDDMTVKARYTINTYIVRFVDYDGKVLKTQTVEHGSDASSPSIPTREGYTFNGWDRSYKNVTENITVQATYKIKTFMVTFRDYDNKIIKVVTVEYNAAAVAPADPVREGYTFTGWDKDFSHVTSGFFVTAQYTINTYTVTFVDYDGTSLKTETVEHGSNATAPADPTREGYTFSGWDTDYSNVKADMTVTAVYVEKEIVTGIMDAVMEHAAEKVMVNGQLYIVRDGRYYDATGRAVRL